jgi:SHS2 domain-containing protein
MSFELFEHTADIGLRIRAETLAGLFEEAGRALFSAMVVNLDEVRPLQEVGIRVEGNDREELLFDWLAELLYRFDADHFVFGEFHVELEEAGLRATARGEPIDPDRHHFDADIKAITYHGFKVEQTDDGWLAEVIVDV